MHKQLGADRTNLEQLWDLLCDIGYQSDHRTIDPSDMQMPTKRKRLFGLSGHTQKYNSCVGESKAVTSEQMDKMIKDVLDLTALLSGNAKCGFKLDHFLHPESSQTVHEQRLSADMKFEQLATAPNAKRRRNKTGSTKTANGPGVQGSSRKKRRVDRNDGHESMISIDSDNSIIWHEVHNRMFTAEFGSWTIPAKTDVYEHYRNVPQHKILPLREKYALKYYDRKQQKHGVKLFTGPDAQRTVDLSARHVSIGL